MFRLAGAAIALILLTGSFQPASSRPEYLSRFQADPLRKPDVDGCATCHINPAGGGTRNEFGLAFAATNHEITPMLRANFPDRFKYDMVKMPNGSTFYFTDPESKAVILERDKQKTIIDLATLSAVKVDKQPEVLPPAENRMSFFVASKGSGNGGHLEGLAGADRICQDLAAAAGAGDRTWRAYLSTSYQDKAAVNAGDRIGTGPWYNAKGTLVARGPADLAANPRMSVDNILTEKGQPVAKAGDEHIDIMTGTLPNGTAAPGMNCNNWTSAEDGKVTVGHSGTTWNSAHTVNGCSPKALQDAGVKGAFYCFAIRQQ